MTRFRFFATVGSRNSPQNHTPKSCCAAETDTSGSSHAQCAFRVDGNLRAAHQENGTAADQGRNGADQENRRQRQVQRQHDSSEDRSEDRTDSSDSKRPAYASGPNVSRIERSSECVRSGLSPNNSRSRKKRNQENCADRVRVSEEGDADRSHEESKRQRAERAKAVHEEAEEQRGDHA